MVCFVSALTPRLCNRNRNLTLSFLVAIVICIVSFVGAVVDTDITASFISFFKFSLPFGSFPAKKSEIVFCASSSFASNSVLVFS